mgnify:CR=1 FL=1
MVKQLLLVDDDVLVLATFSRGLKKAGYAVVTASTGQESLDLANKGDYDLAILDIRMPNLSGIETSAELRKLGVPVIHLTAYDDKETIASALESGAIGYLVKPIDVSKAIPTIEAAFKSADDQKAKVAVEYRLSKALDTANIVNYAVGIISERHRLDQKKAFDLIRNQARSERRRVKDVAKEILDAANYINRFGSL